MIQYQAGVSHDAGEQVIKVMCDAASQHAQALQFLRLEQRRFRLPLLGNVAYDFSELARSSLPCQRHQDAAGKKAGAVFTEAPPLQFRRALTRRLLQLFLGYTLVNILRSKDPGEIVADNLGFGVA